MRRKKGAHFRSIYPPLFFSTRELYYGTQEEERKELGMTRTFGLQRFHWGGKIFRMGKNAAAFFT